MTPIRHLVIVAVAFVGACSMPSLQASPERDREAQALLEDIAADRDETVAGKMSSKVDVAGLRAQLPFIKTLVPDGAPPPGETTAWRANAGTGGMTYVVTRSYDYPDRTLSVSTTFVKEGETWKVLNFNVSPAMKAGAVATPAAPPSAG